MNQHSSVSLAELEARLRLHLLPEIGPRRFRKLLHAFGNASSALSAPASAWRALGLPAICADSRRCSDIRQRTDYALRWLESPQQHVLMFDDPHYPALLAELSDAPPVLYVQGNLALLETPQLAIVGSRRASKPGLETAQAFAQSLAAGGFTITSGLALGIDGAAHLGALNAAGATVAVLGTGIERPYPQRHIGLAKQIAEQGGAVISELPLDCTAQAANFPRRNRIISGLSLGVLVVEASPASGSLITARQAAEQGREVWAIPGSIHHPGARGCHQLIREGATLVESIEHILETLRSWQHVSQAPAAVAANNTTHPLLALLHAAPMNSEALSQASGWELPRVLAALSELEIDGLVSCEAGRWMASVNLLR